MEAPARGRVLVVEDDEALRELLALALTQEGYDVRAVGDGDGAVAAADGWPPGILLLDLSVGGVDVRTFGAPGFGDEIAPAPVLVLSGLPDVEARAELMGAVALAKPFDLDELLGTVRRLLL